MAIYNHSTVPQKHLEAAKILLSMKELTEDQQAASILLAMSQEMPAVDALELPQAKQSLCPSKIHYHTYSIGHVKSFTAINGNYFNNSSPLSSLCTSNTHVQNEVRLPTLASATPTPDSNSSTSSSGQKRTPLPSPPTSDAGLKVTKSSNAKTSSSSRGRGHGRSCPSSAPLQNYRYAITSVDNVESSSLKQDPDCWTGEAIPPIKDSAKDPKLWPRLLTKLGLTPGKFPAFVVKDMRSQPDNKEKKIPNFDKKAPKWPYLVYSLVALSPQGRLKQYMLDGLALAWCSSLNDKNQSLRAGLTKMPEVVREVDSNESQNEGGWYRLARPSENIQKEKKKSNAGEARGKKAAGKKRKVSREAEEEEEDEEEVNALAFTPSQLVYPENDSNDSTNPGEHCKTLSQIKPVSGARKRTRSLTASCDEAIDAALEENESSSQTESSHKRPKVISNNNTPPTQASLTQALPATSSTASKQRLELFQYFREETLQGHILEGGLIPKILLGGRNPHVLLEIAKVEIIFPDS